MFTMLLTCLPGFVSIECYLLFDLEIHLLFIILNTIFFIFLYLNDDIVIDFQ